jgi:hypothetical protein
MEWDDNEFRLGAAASAYYAGREAAALGYLLGKVFECCGSDAEYRKSWQQGMPRTMPD